MKKKNQIWNYLIIYNFKMLIFILKRKKNNFKEKWEKKLLILNSFLSFPTKVNLKKNVLKKKL